MKETWTQAEGERKVLGGDVVPLLRELVVEEQNRLCLLVCIYLSHEQ